MTIPPFETIFAVPLTCQDCVNSVSTSLHALPGIISVDADLSQQLVAITGTAAPSSIVEAIQSTGKDAILRGSGTSDMCILETHASAVSDYVRGLIRMVQVSPKLTVIDLTIRGLSPGTYEATIRQSGDISRGPESVGGIWGAAQKPEPSHTRGILGLVEVNKSGVGAVFLDKPIQIWEMIGRSIIVAQKGEARLSKDNPDVLVGVIARSAGVWDNNKTVCSCSGKTVWEEREEQTGRGML